MPKASYSPAATGETTKVLDGFMAVDPGSDVSVWWDASLEPGAAAALRAAVNALGYLGRSESVCSARLIVDGAPTAITATPAASASSAHDHMDLVDLLCPDADQELTALTVSVTDLRAQRRQLPSGARRVTYAVEQTDKARARVRAPEDPTRPTLAMLRLSGSDRPAITEAVALGQSLRRALQSRFGSANGGDASATFSGRSGDSPRGDQHQHAHYLAAPEHNGRRADRLFVWAPEGFGPGEIAALATLTHLRLHDSSESLRCVLAALGVPGELDIRPLLGQSRTWRSLTPFGLVRHPKTRGGRLIDTPEDQVRAELHHRGWPEPLEVTFEKGSWHRFRSSKVGTSRLQRSRLYGVRILFENPEPTSEPQPLVLGALSHYGLGLMRPDD
jgi:CRISPR-associated protein Csb2